MSPVATVLRSVSRTPVAKSATSKFVILLFVPLASKVLFVNVCVEEANTVLAWVVISEISACFKTPLSDITTPSLPANVTEAGLVTSPSSTLVHLL